MFDLYTPWSGFLTFSGDIEMELWQDMSYLSLSGIVSVNFEHFYNIGLFSLMTFNMNVSAFFTLFFTNEEDLVELKFYYHPENFE